MNRVVVLVMWFGDHLESMADRTQAWTWSGCADVAIVFDCALTPARGH
jgi:hypothetical protein